MYAGKNLLIVLMLLTWSTSANMIWADDCTEARRWYVEGLALSDNSEREASYYRKAIELCPDYFDAHNKLGEVYKSWGAYELAVKEFEQATRNTTLFAEPYNNLGEVYRMQGRYDLAAENFSQAIRINPDFREAQNQLEYVYKRLGKYDVAIESPPELIPTSIFARIPGYTLPKGSYLIDFQYKYSQLQAGLVIDAPRVYGPERRSASVHEAICGIRYGLTDNLTIGLIPKFFIRSADVPIAEYNIDASPSVAGFGDIVFLTKHRLWGSRMTHLAAFCLLSIPTGDEDAEGEDQGIVRRIPLGTGSYDFTPGIAFTTVKEPLTYHTNIWYVIGGRQTGDEFHFDLAIAFPQLYHLISTIELNYRWADSATRRQVYQTQIGARAIGPRGPAGGIQTFETTITEDGGSTLFLSPGVQVCLSKWLRLELGVQLPIIRPDNAWFEEIVAHFGLTKYFF
jgi:hypothetical protein